MQLISRNDQCELGHWLESDESGRFRELPQYAELIASHDAFHKLPGNMISALQKDQEEEALEAQKQFVEMSGEVIGYMHLIQAELTEK